MCVYQEVSGACCLPGVACPLQNVPEDRSSVGSAGFDISVRKFRGAGSVLFSFDIAETDCCSIVNNAQLIVFRPESLHPPQ